MISLQPLCISLYLPQGEWVVGVRRRIQECQEWKGSVFLRLVGDECVCEVENGRDEGIKDDRRDGRRLARLKHVDQGWKGQKTDVIKGRTSDETSCDLCSLWTSLCFLSSLLAALFFSFSLCLLETVLRLLIGVWNMTIMSQRRVETSVTLFRHRKSCVKVVTLTWGGHSSHTVPFPAIYLWRTEDAKIKKYKRYVKMYCHWFMKCQINGYFHFDLHLYLFTFVSFQLFTFPYNFLLMLLFDISIFKCIHLLIYFCDILPLHLPPVISTNFSVLHFFRIYICRRGWRHKAKQTEKNRSHQGHYMYK